MFLNSLSKNKISSTPIGMLHSKDGASFVIEELDVTYSKRLTNMQQKADIKQTRELAIKNNGKLFEPYELITIPFDLTKSSERSNEALLEYLGHPGNINNLILESILDTSTILAIIKNPHYNNNLTKTFLAKSQNLFESETILENLSTLEKIKFFTSNKYRTKDNMNEHKILFKSLIKEILEDYVNDRNDLLSENPSEIRASIIKTCDDFYDKELIFEDIKRSILITLSEQEAAIETEIEAINTIKEALIKYKITGENWQEKKHIANTLIDNLSNETDLKSERITKKINTIKKFPQ